MTSVVFKIKYNLLKRSQSSHLLRFKPNKDLNNRRNTKTSTVKKRMKFICLKNQFHWPNFHPLIEKEILLYPLLDHKKTIEESIKNKMNKITSKYKATQYLNHLNTSNSQPSTKRMFSQMRSMRNKNKSLNNRPNKKCSLRS